MSKQLTVLITGATGNQGGAVARALTNKGHKVRALTRNKHSPAAKNLAELGADLIEGNLDNPKPIVDALQGVDTFYLMGSPMEIGVEGETEQGIALADAAKAANVGHLVYGSVANADKDTGIPHFESKYKVEQHIRSLGIPFTISAPVAFMDNVIAPWSIDALMARKIVQAMPGDIKLQQVSVQNIGEFVASLIDKREVVFDQRLDIAGDELMGSEMADILTQVTQHTIRYENFPTSVLREQSEDMAAMFEWFVKVGYDVDIPALHKTFDDVNWQNYTQWAKSQDWRFLDSKKTV